jgi:hypothetical protein
MQLAERLYNFQSVPGIENCIDQLAGGDIEGTFAELDAAELLTKYGAAFSFHKKEGKTGGNYDAEVVLCNNVPGCAEIKCKIESTVFSQVTVETTLDHAQKQVPKDKPSAIVLKIPQEWFEDKATLKAILSVVESFFAITDHIVCVVIYCAAIIYRGHGPANALRVDQIISDKHKFEGDPPYCLLALTHTNVPGYPPKWVRFPNLFVKAFTPVIRAVLREE